MEWQRAIDGGLIQKLLEMLYVEQRGIFQEQNFGKKKAYHKLQRERYGSKG